MPQRTEIITTVTDDKFTTLSNIVIIFIDHKRMNPVSSSTSACRSSDHYQTKIAIKSIYVSRIWKNASVQYFYSTLPRNTVLHRLFALYLLTKSLIKVLVGINIIVIRCVTNLVMFMSNTKLICSSL